MLETKQQMNTSEIHSFLCRISLRLSTFPSFSAVCFVLSTIFVVNLILFPTLDTFNKQLLMWKSVYRHTGLHAAYSFSFRDPDFESSDLRA